MKTKPVRMLTLICFSFLVMCGLSSAQDTKKKELKPALLVIDVQNAYIPMMDQSDKDLAFKYINGVIRLFEHYKLPVIRVYHQDVNSGPDEKSEAFRFDPKIIVKDDYPMVIKHYGDSFNKTDLDKILKEKGVNTVFLSGLSATGCVLATYVGAENHDYNVFMIQNALLSPDAGQTDFIETIMNTVNYETLNFMLEYTQ